MSENKQAQLKELQVKRTKLEDEMIQAERDSHKMSQAHFV